MSRPPDDMKPLPKPVRVRLETSNAKKGAPPPSAPPVNKDLHYFEQAQRKHGHRRPAQKKPQNKQARGKYTKEIGIVLLGLICMTAVVLGVFLLFSNNALAVYMDDVRVGYLPLNRETREWDADYIHDKSVAHRAANVAATIHVNERITIRPVRTGRRDLGNVTITELIARISQQFTFQIEATAIYVHDERIAIVRALSLAEFVADHFIGAFPVANALETEIIGWELRTLLMNDGELDTPDFAIAQLDRQVESIIRYTVQDGDVKESIARRHEISLNRLLEDNNLAFDAIIRPGDIINIRTTRPFITVRVVEELVRIEIIPMEIITQYSEYLAVGTINIINEGRDGERSITMHIVHENGRAVQERIINEVTTIMPENRIEEVGMSETAAPIWR